MKKLFALVALLHLGALAAQQDLPFYEIPEAQKEYTAKNIVSRSIDGLGFRYYWASKGLTSQDLNFQVTEEARTIRETLEHVRTLSEIVLNSVNSKPTTFPLDWSGLSYEELRSGTLKTLFKASETVKTSENTFDEMDIVFKSDKQETIYPFWNLLNGPLADAIYHTGQITTLRRAAGNPIDPRISVLEGKVRDSSK